MAKEAHAFVKAGQFVEESLESVLPFIPGNAMQLSCAGWELILSEVDGADSGSLNQPILEPGTDDNELLATATLTNEQQQPFCCLHLLVAH